MLISTHFIISKAVLENLDGNKSSFISEKNFIYGNIKPDISSKYVFSKHYLSESFSMVMDKIKYLCHLSLDSLKRYFPISRLSQELGVICHFLCDFFTAPHSERWRFYHSMNKHVTYEKELDSYAKNMTFSNCNLSPKIDNNVEEFFHVLYKNYKSNDISYENDLKYSAYICTSVVSYIIDCIVSNSLRSYALRKVI